MATASEFIDLPSVVCRVKREAIENIFAAYFEAGLVPRVNGTVKERHLQPVHAAAAILGLVDRTSAGAAEAATRLGSLWMDGTSDVSLVQFLSDNIEAHMQRILQSSGAEYGIEDQTWKLTVSLDPLCAWVSWFSADQDLCSRHFVIEPATKGTSPRRLPPAPEFHGLTRLTIITQDVLTAAAELCSGTIMHQTIDPEISTPSDDSGNAGIAKNDSLKPSGRGGGRRIKREAASRP
jgi:hypothetical protein